MSVLRAVVCDCDGVLIESVDVKTDAFRAVFAPEGPDIAELAVAYHLAHGGLSRVEKFRHVYAHVLRRPLSPETLHALCDQFQRLVLARVLQAPWVAGALDALAQLSRRGYALCVISGTPEDELRLILEQRQILHYFEHVYGSPPGKVEQLKRLCADHGLRGDQVLMIGDASTDYEAACAVGAAFLARSRPEQSDGWKQLGVLAVPDARSWPDIVTQFEEHGTVTRGRA